MRMSPDLWERVRKIQREIDPVIIEMRLYHFRLKMKVTSLWRSSQLFF